ncbi:copper ABC transporter substrate-binding protein [Thermosipho ferrireducens]|uniref:Copper ABC transporter substrate-binding protein n=1 Tax=Thermosipho ferrireducens TaxID=2571116 RepID=A0ABX7S486_9BACT|nr:copper ABC transporter substrate-binding protein [Thermosipho ferrireducens]QTA37234.1 copper ABC transporter substrate-binding protein [Thermosipho ferrireducens]
MENLRRWLLLLIVFLITGFTFSETFIVENDLQRVINTAKDGDVLILNNSFSGKIEIVGKRLKIVGKNESVELSFVSRNTENIFNEKPIIYLEDATVTLENVKINASNVVGIGILNSSVYLKNVTIVLSNGIGIVSVSDEKNESYVKLEMVEIMAKKYKKVSGRNVSLIFNGVGVLGSYNTTIVANNVEILGMKKGFILENTESYIFNSSFSENELCLIILSGNQNIINNKFVLNVQGIVAANDSKVSLVNNHFDENNQDIELLTESCNSCPNTRKFTGVLKGYSNVSGIFSNKTKFPAHFWEDM